MEDMGKLIIFPTGKEAFWKQSTDEYTIRAVEIDNEQNKYLFSGSSEMKDYKIFSRFYMKSD